MSNKETIHLDTLRRTFNNPATTLETKAFIVDQYRAVDVILFRSCVGFAEENRQIEALFAEHGFPPNKGD